MTISSGTTRPAADRATEGNLCELLSFRVGGQDYCLDIMSVREIRSSTRATPLPHTPLYMRGVINLRGVVLPVMDLSSRLALDTGPDRNRNVIIVVADGNRTLGLLVDTVSDILAVPEEDMQPPPDLKIDGDRSFISALLIVEDRMFRVLDLDAVLPPPDKDVA